jgi:predicted nucleotidyltransferase
MRGEAPRHDDQPLRTRARPASVREEHNGSRASVKRVVDDALITEAGRRLSEAAPRARVILFGSHARGEAGQRSDVDFLVVEPEVEDEAAESVRLCKALHGLLVPAEVIVVSEDRAHEWRNVPGSLVYAALAEGIDLAV